MKGTKKQKGVLRTYSYSEKGKALTRGEVLAAIGDLSIFAAEGKPIIGISFTILVSEQDPLVVEEDEE